MSSLAGVVVLGVMAATGISFQGSFVEQWHLFRLDRVETSERPEVIRTLGRVGTRASVPALLDLAGSEIHGRFGPFPAYFALTEIVKREGWQAVPVLVDGLRHESWATRWRSTQLLRCVGPQAHAATAALIEALRDEHVYVNAGAVRALGSLGPAAVPALRAIEQDPDLNVRSFARSALLKIPR